MAPLQRGCRLPCAHAHVHEAEDIKGGTRWRPRREHTHHPSCHLRASNPQCPCRAQTGGESGRVPLVLVPGEGHDRCTRPYVHVCVPTVSFRSQSIADVSVDASFTPEKITLSDKNAEVRLRLCFRAKFRPATPRSRVGEWPPGTVGGAGLRSGFRLNVTHTSSAGGEIGASRAHISVATQRGAGDG